MKHYNIVGFLARKHGLNGLKALIDSNVYNVVCVFTHKLKPKSEDVNRLEREDFVDYVNICETNDIPIYAVDSKQDMNKINEVLQEIADFDFIVSISWRKLIPENQLAMPKIAGINLHRGNLPDYAGAEPIKRALINKENEIYITSHILEKEIDSGKIISNYQHRVNYDNESSLNNNVERLKNEITPCFGPLLIESLNSLVNSYESR